LKLTKPGQLWTFVAYPPWLGTSLRRTEGRSEVNRLIRVGTLSGLAVFLAVGIVASYRAYYPISSVRILLAEPLLRPGGGIRVDTVTSGRGPVSIRVELVQGERTATVVLDRVASKRWAFWDFRAVRHTTYAVVSRMLLGQFTAGQAVVRATVVGMPAWLRQPPSVVQEVAVEVQVGPAGTK
jgi:hypothetical protein